jgi:hypothetical protein
MKLLEEFKFDFFLTFTNVDPNASKTNALIRDKGFDALQNVFIALQKR